MQALLITLVVPPHPLLACTSLHQHYKQLCKCSSTHSSSPYYHLTCLPEVAGCSSNMCNEYDSAPLLVHMMSWSCDALFQGDATPVM